MDTLVQLLLPALSDSLHGLSAHLAKELNIKEYDIIKAIESFKPISTSRVDIVEELKMDVVSTNTTTSKPQIWIGKYTDKSFVVGGDGTKTLKDQIKEKGGLWKPHLDRVRKVWMFSLAKYDEMEKFFKEHASVTVDDQYYVSTTPPPVQVQSQSQVQSQPQVKTKSKRKPRFKRIDANTVYDTETQFVLELKKGTRAILKNMRCVGFREEFGSETSMLMPDDVEKIKEIKYGSYDPEQVQADDSADDEDYVLKSDEDPEDDDSEGEEDGE